VPGIGEVNLPGHANVLSREEYAKESHKHLATLDSELADAYNQHEVLKTMGKLAPLAATGFTGPLPPELALNIRKMGAMFGIGDAETMGATELFKMLSQKGVFDLTKSLKPASNLDMIASEKAYASMQSDSRSLPYMIRSEEERSAASPRRRPCSTRS
jgi:hypothetical protein